MKRWPVALVLVGLIGVLSARQSSEPTSLVQFTGPFTFSYLNWENKVSIANGRIRLGAPLTPQGGAGINLPSAQDWTKYAEYSPALRVKIGPKNKIPSIQVLLADGTGSSVYRFVLPTAAGGDQWVIADAGASFASPTTIDKKGAVNLAKVNQWQIMGDWSGDKPTLDLEVSGFAAIPASAEVRKLRADKLKQEEEARQAQQKLLAERRQKYGTRNAGSPNITAVFAAAPDIIGLTIEAKKVIPSRLAPYQAQEGDTKREVKSDKGQVTQVILSRKGEEYGWLIGPKRDQLVTYETLVGDPLLDDAADTPSTFTLKSADDPNFQTGQKPTAIYRKSKPIDWRMPLIWQQPDIAFAVRHTLYLRLPRPLTPGKTYDLDLGNLNTRQATVKLDFDPAQVRSEAVHVNQIGYRPDDKPKRAFLSLWLGTGGALNYPDGLTFRVVRAGTGQSVFSGKVEKALDADGTEKLWQGKPVNMVHTSVYRMDFSPVTAPGEYRVVVDGIGSSYPFSISDDAWERAFKIQMRGFTNQRSGVPLGPPLTSFVKPRDLHPANGDRILQSRQSVLDSGDVGELEKNATTTPVPEAHGGWHDAGDWNPRRVTHMRAVINLMELVEMYPAYFGKVSWGLPGSAKTPDILKECLFELDLFRRLQHADGGIPHGIETNGDPIDGEVSWLQSMTEYVWAPDMMSSYVYATVASRMSRLVTTTDPTLAKTYRESALRAMSWAEKDRSRRKAAGTLGKLSWTVKDDRNFAAISLYELTGDPKWHVVFKEDTVLTQAEPNLYAWTVANQRDAAFAYARLSPKLGDPALKRKAILAVERQAKTALDYAAGNAFNLTTSDPGQPMFLGFYSVPNAIEVARAHFLTQKPEYLAGVVQATQFSSGANPGNQTYTTGVGLNPPVHPLKLDARRTGQPAPIGLTVYGNTDYNQWTDSFQRWPLGAGVADACKPSAYEWPIHEAFFDIFLYPAMTEWTMDQTFGPNAYIWGYLAARK